MKEYKAGLKKYQPHADTNDPFHVYGWGAAETMTDALKRMKTPTRASLMEAVRQQDRGRCRPLSPGGTEAQRDEGPPLDRGGRGRN